MASVEKRTRDGRVTWQARWRDPSGRQRKRTFPRRVDAERYLTGVDHSKLAGVYVDPARSNVTVAVWADRWLAGLQVKPSTKARYASDVRVHILPAWGTTPLAGVAHSAVVTWVAPNASVTPITQRGVGG